jgi:hypothetical protein
MDSSKATSLKSETWIGGVCGLHGFKHAGKPMRVAAWMTSSGNVLGAAIVEAKGPAVLRQLFDELMESKASEELPARVIVWPSARAAFRDVVHPPVTVERNEFLRVVIEDQASFGRYPGELEVRRG